MTNQPNQVAEVLCEMCFTNTVTGDTPKDCYMHIKGITKDCDKLQQALTKLTEMIKDSTPVYPNGVLSKEVELYRNIFIENLTQAGFPLNNKGGE